MITNLELVTKKTSYGNGFTAVRVKIATHQKIRLGAAIAGTSMAEWMEQVVTRALEEMQEKEAES